MAVKLARAAGCRVLLSSSSDEKLARLKARYAQPTLLTVNYATNSNWHEEVVRLNNGKGVDLVLENGGTGSLVKSIKATRRGGTVSQVGYLGKQDPADLKELLSVLIDRRVNLRYLSCGNWRMVNANLWLGVSMSAPNMTWRISLRLQLLHRLASRTRLIPSSHLKMHKQLLSMCGMASRWAKS